MELEKLEKFAEAKRRKIEKTFEGLFRWDKKMASNLENSQRKLRALSCPRPKHSGLFRLIALISWRLLSFRRILGSVMSWNYRAGAFLQCFLFLPTSFFHFHFRGEIIELHRHRWKRKVKTETFKCHQSRKRKKKNTFLNFIYIFSKIYN